MARTAPAFWWRPSPGAALVLWPLAAAYAVAARTRMTRPPRFVAPVPVICIGNYVVGGAGKTPTAIALAKLAAGAGLRPGMLARGYGGGATVPILVDPAVHRADEVGDEPLLLAAAAPTVVSPDRVAGARRLVERGVDLIILDDGLQNPALAKDLAIVAIDAAAGIGNGFTLPLGPLRAPLAVQIAHTDALLVIGEGTAADGVARMVKDAGRSVLHALLKPVAGEEFRGERVYAFAGIGRPQKFFDSLGDIGATVVEGRAFGDHHVFSEAEARELLAEAEEAGARLVTTAKDAARLKGRTGALAELAAKAAVLEVTLEFDDPAAVLALIAAVVRQQRP